MKTMPSKNAGKRAYSYLRWSTPPQEWGDSERRQSELAKRYCAVNGLELCDTVADRGISAFHGLNRENGLKKLTDSMRPGDVLLVEDCDRLSRQGWLETSNLINSFLERGVEVVTLRNGSRIDRESFARNPGIFLPVVFGGHLGNEESVKKSYRVRESWDAKKRNVSKGKAARHKFWAWLRWDTELDKPVLIPEKAAVVRKIYAWALEGYGALAIARMLKEKGVKPITKRAGNWSSDYVHRVLTNKAVIGWYTHVEPPQPGIYPPAVDEATFYAVQELVKSRGQNKGATVRASAEASNLFTKIATCECCGSSLTLHRQMARGKKYGYLVCSGSRRSVGNCGLASIRYDYFERSFLNMACQFDEVQSRLSGKKSEPSAADVLTAKLTELEQKSESFLRLIEGDTNPPKRLLARLKEIEAEEAEVREKLEAEKGRVRLAQTPYASLAQFRKLLEGKADDQQHRLKLKTAIAQIVGELSVNLKSKSYAVTFRGSDYPVTCKLDAGGNATYGVTECCSF